MSIKTITPSELHALKAAGEPVDLLDVRTPMEFREVHAEYACNVPLDRLDPAQVMHARKAADKPLYVICRSGGRAQKACQQFITAGFPNVVNVEGGTLAWVEAGLPSVRGQVGIPLERQVRIAAGLLVLAGVLLGWFVHPGWLGLAAFVGAGLICAGVTGHCGMGLLLAYAPWNRGKDQAACCASSPCG